MNRSPKTTDEEAEVIVEDESEGNSIHADLEKPKKVDESKKESKGKHDNMVRLVGGKFIMGTEEPHFHSDGEGPTRPVILDGFYMDVTETSNKDFAEFVKETGYETEAEKFGNSFVFFDMMTDEQQEVVNESVAVAPWWYKTPQSSWKEPEGIKSNLDSR